MANLCRIRCVTLLDSTSVTVQPIGSGSFAVCKTIRIQTLKGAVANRIIKYDYDPLTAHAEFRYVTIYRTNGDVINLDVTQACDYAAPARAIYWGARQIMLEIGRGTIRQQYPEYLYTGMAIRLEKSSGKNTARRFPARAVASG